MLDIKSELRATHTLIKKAITALRRMSDTDLLDRLADLEKLTKLLLSIQKQNTDDLKTNIDEVSNMSNAQLKEELRKGTEEVAKGNIP